MVEITNREQLESWLTGRDRSDAVVIAARVALRVLPQLQSVYTHGLESPGATIVLPCFRATAISRVTAVGPTREIEASAASAYATAYASAASAATAAYATAASAYAAASADAAAYASAASAAAAASADAASATAARAEIWNSITEDVAALDNGIGPAALAASRLWLNEISFNVGKPVRQPFPTWVDHDWKLLKSNLLAAENEDWAVWTSWYEARLRGDPPNEDLERAIALIDPKIWDQGPKIANTEIRRLIGEYRPTRDELAKTPSPQPVAKNDTLDVQPTDEYDSANVSEELATLPTRQRITIKALLGGIKDDRNISPAVVVALQEYDGELVSNGPRPMLGILIDMHQIVRDEYLAQRREGVFENEGGLRRSFLGFTANHKQIIEHFPLNAVRERMYRETPVDRTALNIGEVRELANQFVLAIDTVAEGGFATPDFVRVSHRIADDLKAATFIPPPAPVDAMDANRSLMEHPELTAADRAVIKAMTFSDSLRAALSEDNFSERAWKRIGDAALITTLVDWGIALARAFGF